MFEFKVQWEIEDICLVEEKNWNANCRMFTTGTNVGNKNVWYAQIFFRFQNSEYKLAHTKKSF